MIQQASGEGVARGAVGRVWITTLRGPRWIDRFCCRLVSESSEILARTVDAASSVRREPCSVHPLEWGSTNVDVSLLLSATSRTLVQDLLDANKLVRIMRRSASQTLRFLTFDVTGIYMKTVLHVAHHRAQRCSIIRGEPWLSMTMNEDVE